MSDITRRKKNVVVCGLSERCDTTNQQQSDEAAFNRLCEEHLSVKPSVSQKGCKRLGKLTDGSHQPRRLLVHLTSEENVSHILSAAKSLRRSDDAYIAKSVYINPEMSPAEAKLAFEKRAKRRAEAQQTQNAKTTDGSTARGAETVALDGNTFTASTVTNGSTNVIAGSSSVLSSPSPSPLRAVSERSERGSSRTFSALTNEFIPSTVATVSQRVETE